MALLRTKQTQTLWGAALVAILACAFCLFNIYLHTPEAAESASQFCPTNGCTLFEDFTVFGISLWFIGAVVFLFFCALSLKGSRALVHFFASIGLFLDSILLMILIFTSPCVSCLVVAFAFALIYFFSQETQPPVKNNIAKYRILLICWAALFISNIFSVLEESLGAWVITGPQHAEIQLYFSPSCPACVEVLKAMGSNPQVAFLPVAKTDGDKEVIFRMRDQLKAGEPLVSAFDKAMNSQLPAELDLAERLLFSFKLYRNRAESMRIGNKTLPLMVVNNIPALLVRPDSQATHSQASQELDSPNAVPNALPEPLPEDFTLDPADAPLQSPLNSNNLKNLPQTSANQAKLKQAGELQKLFMTDGIGNCSDKATEPCPPANK